jgi:hypothetical protein
MIWLTVLGGTLTVSLVAFRFLELGSVPACVRARVVRFSSAASLLLMVGAAAMIIGIVGLAHPTGGSP